MKKMLLMMLYSLIFAGLTSPVYAAIYNVWESVGGAVIGPATVSPGNRPVDASKKSRSCSTAGYLSSAPNGNICDEVTVDDYTCYANCRCDTAKFPYNLADVESSQYFVVADGSETCTDGAGTHVSNVACNSKVASSSLSLKTYFNVSGATHNGVGGVTVPFDCYSMADLTCKGTTSSHSSIPLSDIRGVVATTSRKPSNYVLLKGDPIAYEVVFNWGVLSTAKHPDYDSFKNKPGLVGCTIGAEFTKGAYNASGALVDLTSAIETTVPTTVCAKYETKTAAYFPFTYYYYTGGCNNTLDQCTGGGAYANDTCATISTTTESGYGFNPSTFEQIRYSCLKYNKSYYTTNEKDSKGNYCFTPATYDTPSEQLTGFKYEVLGEEQVGAIAVTGCDTTNGYELYVNKYNNSDPAALVTDLSVASNGKYTYTAYGIKTDDYDWDREGIDCGNGDACYDYMICRDLICPSNSTELDGDCICNNGYQPYRNTCVLACASGIKLAEDGTCTACEDEHAYYVDGENPSCECNEGYILSDGVCIDKLEYCHSQDKKYDSVSDKCVTCAAGTVLDKDLNACYDCGEGQYDFGLKQCICEPGQFSNNGWGCYNDYTYHHTSLVLSNSDDKRSAHIVNFSGYLITPISSHTGTSLLSRMQSHCRVNGGVASISKDLMRFMVEDAKQSITEIVTNYNCLGYNTEDTVGFYDMVKNEYHDLSLTDRIDSGTLDLSNCTDTDGEPAMVLLCGKTMQYVIRGQ